MANSWRKLVPFRSTERTTPFRISADFSSEKNEFRVRFRLDATSPEALARVRLPPAKSSAERKDELWKTTCFECFFGVKGSEAYYELNTAPSGDWAWYRFEGYRKGMNSPESADLLPPRVLSTKRNGTGFEIEWSIPFSLVAAAVIDAIGVTSVLEIDGEWTYWALAHTGAEADFHRRDSFEAL